MKKEELAKLIENKKQEVLGIYNKALEMSENNIYDIEEYVKIGAVGKSYWGKYRGLLESISVDSLSLDNRDIRTTIDGLKEFEKEWGELQEIGKSEIRANFEEVNFSIVECHYSYTYYRINPNSLESEQKASCRAMVSALLKPEKEKKEQQPDCKMMELFKEGIIDWETLQEITYKNCDV